MKTKSIKQLTAILVMVTALMVVMYSCKKMDLKPSVNTDGSGFDRAKASIDKRIAEMGGVPQVFPVHKKMDFYWADKNGIPKDPKATINSAGCTNYDYPDFIDFVQYQRIYDCDANSGAGGYYIQWEYNVSWSKTIVLNNGTVSTAGYIAIVNDLMSTTDLTLTITNVIIEDMGVGPNAPNHVYNVKFNFNEFNPHDGIDDYFVNGDLLTDYTINLSATFATSCPDDISLWSVPASAYGFTGKNGMWPCHRNDYVFFLDPTYMGTNRIGIVAYDGYNTCSGFGGNFVRPDLQQVEYTIDGGANWSPFVNDYHALPPTGNLILPNGYLRSGDWAESANISSGTYTVIIRFRNWKYASIPSPLSIPNTSNGDCRGPDNQSLPTAEIPHSEWAYEVWPLITF